MIIILFPCAFSLSCRYPRWAGLILEVDLGYSWVGLFVRCRDENPAKQRGQLVVVSVLFWASARVKEPPPAAVRSLCAANKKVLVSFTW